MICLFDSGSGHSLTKRLKNQKVMSEPGTVKQTLDRTTSVFELKAGVALLTKKISHLPQKRSSIYLDLLAVVWFCVFHLFE